MSKWSFADSRSSSSSTLCSPSVDGNEEWTLSPRSGSTLRSTASGSKDKAVAPQLNSSDSPFLVQMVSPGSTVSSVSTISSAGTLAKRKSNTITTTASMKRLSRMKSLFSIKESGPAIQRPPDVGTFSDSDSSEDNDEKKKRRLHFASRGLSEEDLARLQQKTMDLLGIELHRPPGAPRERWFIRIQRLLGILHARVYIALKQQRVKAEPPYYPTARYIVSNIRFDMLIAALILTNTVVIGFGTSSIDRKQQHWAIEASEHVFTFLFLIEFVLRIMAYTWVWIFDPLNMFDTLIVWIPGVLVTWIMLPLGSDVAIVHVLKTLRILRVVRLIRVVRLHPYFHELWMLVSGVVGCTQLLFWACIIMGAVHFMFAVASVEMLGKSIKFEDDELVQSYFGSLLPAMFTLFQLMTFSTWGSIIRPIVFRAPEMCILFFLWIGIAGIVLRNLLTAIMVSNAFEANENDKVARSLLKQSEQIKMEKELHAIFADLDEDSNGTLSKDEFTDVLGEQGFMRKMKTLDVDLDELPEFFAIIDDGDGCITIEEFCDGLARMQGQASSRDLLYATYKMKRLRTAFSEVENFLDDFAGRGLEQMENALERSQDNFLKMHTLTADILQNINRLGVRKVVQASALDLPTLTEPTSNELVTRSSQVQPLAAATSMSPFAPGRLDSIPPTWVARRREDARKRQNTERNPMRKREPLEEGLRESVERKKLAVPAAEWDSLQVSHNLLQSPSSGAKTSNDLSHAEAIALPSALVQRAATHSAFPAAVLNHGTRVQKPKSVPEHKSLSLM